MGPPVYRLTAAGRKRGADYTKGGSGRLTGARQAARFLSVLSATFNPADYFWLIGLGLGVGLYGTLIGAGGGFVLMPVLLLLYPEMKPENLTAISLAVVFFNAASGTESYAT